MKKIKKLTALLLATVMMVAFASCASTSTDTEAETTTDQAIVLGGIGPLTGAAAIYGTAAKNGAQIAVNEINALGGQQFKLIYEDDEHDAEKSVNAYNSLKDDGLQILLGTVTTTPCVAVSALTNTDRIFELTPSASSTDVIGGQADADGNVTIARKDNVFQMCFTDPNQGIASAQYISENELGTKIAVIYNNADAYSTGIYTKFMAEAEELGLDVVSETTFTDDTATDFSAQLQDAKNNGADLIFLPIYYTPASQIMIQADAIDYSPKYFGVDGMDGILTLEGFDTSLAEGVMLLTPFSADSTDEKTVTFVSEYKEAYGETPNQFAADGYDTVYAVYQAIKQGNITADMSAQDMCDKLIEIFTSDSFSYDGLTGEDVTWSSTGEVSKAPKGVVIENGEYVGMDVGTSD